MSFSSDQKTDIMSQALKSSCCRRAFMQGVLSARAESCDGKITVVADSAATAEFFATMIKENYSKDAAVTTLQGGGRGRRVIFSSKSADAYLTDFRGGKIFYTERCPMCEGAYLRGVFLASGRVTDPMKQYLLEFAPKREVIGRFVELFDELGMISRVSVKPRESVIYFKNSAQIEDFFALAGMNQTTFALMNAKIQGEIRNTANRIANCETNNIGKAVSASMSQIAVLEELESRGLLSQLPDELEMTARLRMKHRDLSLSQLAALITPHISKPGLSHRLKKITEIAAGLLERSRRK